MQIAFSSSACPGWNLTTIIEKAQEFGYAGIEIAAEAGLAHLHAAPELSRHTAQVADQLAAAGVRIVCLATSADFSSKDAATWAANQSDAKEHIELASRLGCPFVRVLAGSIPGGRPWPLRAERRDAVLARIIAAIRDLVPFAAEHRVVLLVENSGDFLDSSSLWQIVESVNSPVVKCCWDSLTARLAHERPTVAIPRLASKIAMVRICDAVFDENHRFIRYALPGEGGAEIRRTVQLLRGKGYRGFLVFSWPSSASANLPGPEAALPAAASYLQTLIAEQPVALSAYKGDKFRPRQGFEFSVSS